MQACLDWPVRNCGTGILACVLPAHARRSSNSTDAEITAQRVDFPPETDSAPVRTEKHRQEYGSEWCWAMQSMTAHRLRRSRSTRIRRFPHNGSKGAVAQSGCYL